MRKTLFYFSAFHQRQRKMRTTGLLSRHSKNGKTKKRTCFVNNVVRKTFPVLSIVAIRISHSKSTKRCAACRAVVFLLRYCAGVKQFIRVRIAVTKQRKRFVLVQRFMPAYALCRHIIKLYKNQCGRGQALAWCECAYFLAAKTRSGALRAEWQCPTVCDMRHRFLRVHSLLSAFKRFFERQQVICLCRAILPYLCLCVSTYTMRQ